MAAAAAALLGAAHAAVWMPAVFSDNMVLQQQAQYDQRPFFFGTASPGEVIVLNRTLEIGGGDFQSYSVVADSSGNWIAQLNCDNNPANFLFTIAGSSDGFARMTAIHNVTYGDVYV